MPIIKEIYEPTSVPGILVILKPNSPPSEVEAMCKTCLARPSQGHHIDLFARQIICFPDQTQPRNCQSQYLESQSN